MAPEQFITRWKGSNLTERTGAQAHFSVFCELLKSKKPRDLNAALIPDRAQVAQN